MKSRRIVPRAALVAALLIVQSTTAWATSALDGMGSVAFFVVALMLNGMLFLVALLGSGHLAWRLGVLGASVAVLMIFGTSARSGSDMTLVAVVAPVIGMVVLFTMPQRSDGGTDGAGGPR